LRYTPRARLGPSRELWAASANERGWGGHEGHGARSSRRCRHRIPGS